MAYCDERRSIAGTAAGILAGMSFDTPTLLATALCFLLAGLVKGLLGLGLPTVSLALLSLFLPLPAAMRLMLLPSLVTNLWQGLVGGQLLALIRKLWPLLLLLALGTWLGAGLLAPGDAKLAQALLGGVLLAYALFGLLGRPFALAAQSHGWVGAVAGGITGVITGMTGSFTMPSVPYLQSIGLARDALVQAMGLVFSVATLALGLALAGHGGMRGGGMEELAASAAALLPAGLGMWLGARVRPLLSPLLFRRWTFICLAVLGVHLLLSPWL